MTETATTPEPVPLMALTPEQMAALQAYIASIAPPITAPQPVSCQTVETYSD